MQAFFLSFFRFLLHSYTFFDFFCFGHKHTWFHSLGVFLSGLFFFAVFFFFLTLLSGSFCSLPFDYTIIGGLGFLSNYYLE